MYKHKFWEILSLSCDPQVTSGFTGLRVSFIVLLFAYSPKLDHTSSTFVLKATF